MAVVQSSREQIYTITLNLEEARALRATLAEDTRQPTYSLFNDLDNALIADGFPAQPDEFD